MNKFMLLIAAGLLTACTHSIHQVHTSGFAPYQPFKNGTLVTAKTEQFVVLWFAKDSDYVQYAYKDLMDQCVDGEITGITTQFSTSHGFLSWTNKILMQGHCFKS